MSEISERLLEEQLQWYRLQRHDFLNHFQVIMGYLQLEKPEKAMKYMQEALRGMEGEQKLAQIPVPEVNAILLGWILQLKNNGTLVSLEFAPEMTKSNFWEKNWKQEYVEEFYGYTRKCLDLITMEPQNEESLRAIIRLFEDTQGWNCSFILQDELSVRAQEIWRN